jgi:hypothetical protein
MSKDIDNPQGFANELQEILATIEKVKGEKYAHVLRLTFALSNYGIASGDMMQGMAEASKNEDTLVSVMVMRRAFTYTLADTFNILIDALLVEKQGEDEPHHAYLFRKLGKVQELNADIETLSKKQDEYGSWAIGGRI